MAQEQRPRAAKGEGATQRVGGGFTAVPHELLRKEGWFREPLDFMVYMTLFSYSHGFGRPTADMSQSQLERFTGAAKNTIKRSLERLTKDGWIKLVEEYEHARVSRKWRVFRPEDRRGPRPGRHVEEGESRGNTVRPVQSPERIPSLSKADTLTVSNVDPYIDISPKEKSKNSLSPFEPRRSNEGRIQTAPATRESALPGELKAYLDSLRPARKRQSEYNALTELAVEFKHEDLVAALAWVRKHGLPGSGDPAHSPLAFLAAGGITRVMGVAREERSK
ncbi:MAG: helix-turn-helix domain-containing protein, partial [Bdellovibrionales bacterium]|nr:helix-turn-helix domain-containing protein [Bdellovibrionales bacterium]